MLLTFDTSLDKTYIGLADGYKLLGTKVLENQGSTYHSTYLMPSITEILKENNLTPQDITAIATNVGPGSFTGIRACTTVARVMAQQLDCKVLGRRKIITPCEVINLFRIPFCHLYRTICRTGVDHNNFKRKCQKCQKALFQIFFFIFYNNANGKFPLTHRSLSHPFLVSFNIYLSIT